MLTNSVSLVKTLNTQKTSTPTNVTRLYFGSTPDKIEFKTAQQTPKKSFVELILDFFQKIINFFRIEKNEDYKNTDIKSATARLKKANQVMSDLVRIVEEDQQRAIPVFKSIKVGTFQKMFHYAYKHPEKTLTVGITGGSASGKSYITEEFTKALLEKCP